MRKATIHSLRVAVDTWLISDLAGAMPAAWQELTSGGQYQAHLYFSHPDPAEAAQNRPNAVFSH